MNISGVIFGEALPLEKRLRPVSVSFYLSKIYTFPNSGIAVNVNLPSADSDVYFLE